MRIFNKTLVLTFALILALSLSLALVSSYPYSNYYGPSDNTYYKETKSVDNQRSLTISDGDFYKKETSRTIEKTTKEQKADTSDYFSQPRRYISPSYSANRYYSAHFDDYQPHYSYRQYGYYPNSRFSRPEITYISGDNPEYVGREHYYQDYYYQPQYDWHLGYYNWNY